MGATHASKASCWSQVAAGWLCCAMCRLKKCCHWNAQPLWECASLLAVQSNTYRLARQAQDTRHSHHACPHSVTILNQVFQRLTRGCLSVLQPAVDEKPSFVWPPSFIIFSNQRLAVVLLLLLCCFCCVVTVVSCAGMLWRLCMIFQQAKRSPYHTQGETKQVTQILMSHPHPWSS